VGSALFTPKMSHRVSPFGVCAPFPIIQATLNGCCPGFILEPREPGEGIKTEPSVSLHADAPRDAASARWSPSPTLGALAIRIRGLIAALA
jgi:hypothetical protein